MRSSWAAETIAIIRKETLTELRGRHGLFTSLLFAVMAVTAIGMAAARGAPSPSLAAGMLWVALLFAAITGLARTFILEEEQGTGDLLRLWARPEPIFWGKLFFNLGLQLIVALVLVPMYILFVGVSVEDMLLLVSGLIAGCLALAAAVSVCGVLVSQARSRGTLAGVIATPVLLPLIWIGLGAVRVAFGAPSGGGWESVLGLAGLATAFLAVGPYLFAAVWKQ